MSSVPSLYAENEQDSDTVYLWETNGSSDSDDWTPYGSGELGDDQSWDDFREDFENGEGELDNFASFGDGASGGEPPEGFDGETETGGDPSAGGDPAAGGDSGGDEDPPSGPDRGPGGGDPLDSEPDREAVYISAGNAAEMMQSGMAVKELLNQVYANSAQMLGKDPDADAPPSIPPGGHETKRGDPVSLFSGAFTRTEIDLQLPSAAGVFELKRHYNSHFYASGVLGPKWAFDFEERLQLLETPEELSEIGMTQMTSALLVRADGSAVVFRPKEDGGTELYAPGVPEILEVRADRFILHSPDLSFRRYSRQGHYPPYEGRLMRVEDRSGRAVRYERDDQGQVREIHDSSGRIYTVNYQSGLATSIWDDDGPFVEFEYDFGHLSKVSYRGAQDGTPGPEYSYTYHYGQGVQGWNCLKEVRNAEGVVVLRNEYDDVRMPRVVRQEFEGAETTFTYEVQSDRRQTTLVDAQGNVSISKFDAIGRLDQQHMLLSNASGNGPHAAITRYQYGPGGLITQITYPNGNKTKLTYDRDNDDHAQTNNLIELRSLSAADETIEIEEYEYTYFNVLGKMRTAQGTTYNEVDENTGNVREVALTSIDTPSGHRPPTTVWGEYLGGRARERTDPGGLVTEFGYDNQKLLNYTGRDPEGINSVHRITHDNFGRVESEHAPNGAHVEYMRDGRGNALEIHRDGVMLQERQYDRYDRVTRVRDFVFDETGAADSPAFVDTTHTYDDYGRLVRTKVEADGTPWQEIDYILNETGQVVAASGLGIRPRSMVYDERGLLTELTMAPGTPAAHTRRFFYDPNGNLARVVDGRGTESRFVYDGVDRPVEEIDGLGNRLLTSYAEANLVAELDRYDPDGVRQFALRNEWDAAGNLREKRVARLKSDGTVNDWITESVEVDVDGNTVEHSSPATGTTQSEFDLFGDEIKRTDAVLNELQLKRDKSGRVVESVRKERFSNGAFGVVERTMSWDSADRMTLVGDSSGRNESFAYDSQGRLRVRTLSDGTMLVAQWDPLGRPTANRLLDENGDEQWAELTEYNDTGEVAAVTDALGRKISYHYDEAGRLVEIHRPDGRSWIKFKRDENGNVIEQEDGRGVVVKQKYDELNRLVERTVSGATAGAQWERFEYDANNNVTRAENPYADVRQIFDSRGLLVQSSVNSLVTKRGYDAAGRCVELSYPSGYKLEIDHDDSGRPTQLKGDAAQLANSPSALDGTLASFAYHGRGLPAELSTRNGVKTKWTYDALGRPMILKTLRGTTVLNEELSLRDALDRVQCAAEKGGEAAVLEYDSAGRLSAKQPVASISSLSSAVSGLRKFGNSSRSKTQAAIDSAVAQLASTATSGFRLRWRYDEAGNRLRHYIPGRDLVFTVNDRDELDAAGGTPPQWDGGGDLVSDGERTYEYDYAHRLCKVIDDTTSDTVFEARYDALGRMIWVSDGAEARSISFDGHRPIEEHDSAGALHALHVWHPGDEQLLVIVNAGSVMFAHPDLRKSIALLTSDSGQLLQRMRYGTFGDRVTTGPSGATQTPLTDFGFTSRRHLDGLPLVNLGARMLHTQWGRFIVPDPSGFGDGLNPYVHAAGNPVSMVDWNGHRATLVGGALGAAWGVGWASGSYVNDFIHEATDGQWGEPWKGVEHAAGQVAQFAVSGAMIGAAIDLAPVGQGAVSAALGGAGFSGAMSAFDGSWSGFAVEVPKGAAIGFGVWGVGRLAAPVLAPVAAWAGGTGVGMAITGVGSRLGGSAGAGLIAARSWVGAEGSAAASALGRLPGPLGRAVNEIGAGATRATGGSGSVFGRQWRLITQNRNGSTNLLGGNRYGYSWRNMVNESRIGRDGFNNVSQQYWRGQANGNSLQHLFSEQARGRMPEWFKNSGLNLMEIPFALNSWAAGIARRELGIRFSALGISGLVGTGTLFNGWELKDYLNQQAGGDAKGCE